MRAGFLAAAIAGCGNVAQAQSVQVIGDSILVWNSWTDASVVDLLEAEFGGSVENNAASGAFLTNPNPLGRIFGYDIQIQYEPGEWDWVIVDGGGNDLIGECGCGLCDAVLEDLSSGDGRQGAMPELINQIRDDGSQVVLMGYYLTPTSGTEWVGCADDMTALNARYQAIADRDVDVYFFDPGTVIAREDLTLFDADLLHPSVKGSEILADAIADIITAN
ncbi:MAG: SGNH/GDSL hydrolase family protein [Pseudomonadota bacterium]